MFRREKSKKSNFFHFSVDERQVNRETHALMCGMAWQSGSKERAMVPGRTVSYRGAFRINGIDLRRKGQQGLQGRGRWLELPGLDQGRSNQTKSDQIKPNQTESD
jgi:hypothetical protein